MDEIITYVINSVYPYQKSEKFEGLEIADDGTFKINDHYAYKFYLEWDRLGLLNGLRAEEKKITSHNFTILTLYFYLFKPKMVACGLLVGNMYLALIRRAATTEKLRNPSKFWNFILDFMHENSDKINDILDIPNIDVEAHVCCLIVEEIKKILAAE